MSDLHTNGTANCAASGAQDDIVAEIAAVWHDERSRTHCDTCWQWHAPCAIAILVAEIEVQQAELDRLRTALELAGDRLAMTGAPQATIDAIRKAVRGDR